MIQKQFYSKCWIWALATALFLQACALQPKETTLYLLQTGDIHGALFSYDFKTNQDLPQGFDRFSSYLTQMRAQHGDRCLAFDLGDNLQGQPVVYYYNYVDTASKHILMRVLNRVPYTAGVVGNHDIEAGHAVYDRMYADSQFPILAANIVREDTGKPYFTPYTIIKRDGFKIALLGLITPNIPDWLPYQLWSGMQFRDMLEAAQEWVPYILEKEAPDVLIGLFHSGTGTEAGGENASFAVATQVPGFDLVYSSHDHRARIGKVAGPAGDSLWLVNTGANMVQVSEMQMHLERRDDGTVAKTLDGVLLPVKDLTLDTAWRAYFAEDFEKVKAYISEPVGYLERPIRGAEALEGPSAFVDWVHEVQISLTKADISFAAPLSASADIPARMLTVGDFFSWYPYENSLYMIQMTGEEVQKYLEYSYDGWLGHRRTPSYNFDSAAGIRYEVNKNRPFGQRVRIVSMADGTPFRPQASYSVVLNSYRANGGGGHLAAAGIPSEKLTERILWRGVSDFRSDMIAWVRAHGSFAPRALDLWHF
jgi:5''-nucleotidase/2'',3''-cyclic phosphodiesterase and related esterases